MGMGGETATQLARALDAAISEAALDGEATRSLYRILEGYRQLLATARMHAYYEQMGPDFPGYEDHSERVTALRREVRDALGVPDE